MFLKSLSPHHAEWILNRTESTFNGTFVGCKNASVVQSIFCLKSQVKDYTGWGLSSGTANRGCSEACSEAVTKNFLFLL